MCKKQIIPGILFILISSIANLYGAEKSYLGGIIAFNYSSVWVNSSNDNITSYEWISKDIGALGIEYSYDFFKINYQTDFRLSKHIGEATFSNNSVVLKNNISYHTGAVLVHGDTGSGGPGWSDEDYDFSEYDAYSLQYTGELGYLFTYDFWIFKKLSYKMIYMHNEVQEPGLGLGILTSLVYDYSTFRGNEILIPAGEREYYNRCGTYKGDEITTIGLKVTPMISYMFEDILYVAAGVSPMPLYYEEAKIFTEDETIDVSLESKRLNALILAGGIKANSVMFSTYMEFKTNGRYLLPDEDDVEITNSLYTIEIRAGVLF